jgi:hypothetical protein
MIECVNAGAIDMFDFWFGDLVPESVPGIHISLPKGGDLTIYGLVSRRISPSQLDFNQKVGPPATIFCPTRTWHFDPRVGSASLVSKTEKKGDLRFERDNHYVNVGTRNSYLPSYPTSCVVKVPIC